MKAFVVVAAAIAAACFPAAVRGEPAGGAAAGLLAPADTSSPRDTLRSFRAAVDDVFRHVRSGQVDGRRATMLAIRRVLSCLDLRGIAPSLAAPRGQEAAVCLKEVLDRIELPPDEAIPGDEEVAKSGPKRWRIPGTEIVLARVADGPREGEYLFDEETVARSGEFYARVRHLQYRPGAGSPGLHAVFVAIGGWMIPERLLRALPPWAHATILGESAWQWIAAGVLFAVAGAGVWLAWRVSSRCRRDGRPGLGAAFVFPLAVIGAALALDYALTAQVRFTGETLYVAKLGLRITAFAGVIGGVVVLLRGLADLLIGWRRLRPDAIETQLVRLGCQLATFLVVAWLAILGADSLGLSVTPLVAGLSISGLAFALAAQYTVENLIAGIVIFADKPVRIGDECRYGDVHGTVEQIGLRSTRIRCVDRTLVSIPNAEFAKQQVVNHGCRDRILLRHVLRLPDAGPAARVRDLIGRLRGMLVGHPGLAGDSVRVRLVACDGATADVEVFAYAATRDHEEYLAVQEDVLFRVMDLVAGADAAAVGRARLHEAA